MTSLDAFEPDDAPCGQAQSRSLPPVGSSFFLGLRILPAEQRTAMFAIYAFCRAVDDVADGEGTSAQRKAALEHWRAALHDLYAGLPLPALQPLEQAIRRFGLDRRDFDAIIDGMMMDAEADIRAPDAETLDRYIDCVASAPGRLSVRVFGLDREMGAALAHHLGRALQLTNILRDIDEDAERGRLYLPREALTDAGINELPTQDILADPRLSIACRTLAEQARAHFAQAGCIMDRAPRRRVRAPRLMAAAYRPVLDRLAARGWAAPRRRVSKSKRVLAAAVLRYGLF